MGFVTYFHILITKRVYKCQTGENQLKNICIQLNVNYKTYATKLMSPNFIPWLLHYEK